MTDEYDTSGRRDRRLDNTNDVRDRKTGPQGPHGEVLESRGRRRELVAESIVLHVDPNQIIQPRRRETEDSRDFFGVEKIRRLVPVDPHPSQIVAKKIVKGISRKER